MKSLEKREFIHRHLHKINDSELDDIYYRIQSLLNDILIDESEQDINNNNLIDHEILKEEIQTWRDIK